MPSPSNSYVPTHEAEPTEEPPLSSLLIETSLLTYHVAYLMQCPDCLWWHSNMSTIQTALKVHLDFSCIYFAIGFKKRDHFAHEVNCQCVSHNHHTGRASGYYMIYIIGKYACFLANLELHGFAPSKTIENTFLHALAQHAQTLCYSKPLW